MSENFSPTSEQALIVAAARPAKQNILVQALAGAAKTSTLVLIAQAMPGVPMLCVAFNKRIAEEMSKRLPSHCVAKTLNSIGHVAWGQAIGKRLTLNARKMGDILRSFDLPRSDAEELREVFGDVVQLASRAKLYGYVPEGRYDEALHLTSRDTLEEVFAEQEYPLLAWSLLDQLLMRSITMAYDGVIDFDDQIYMSTLFGAQLPRFPRHLVDEAQDLSPLNHEMLRRLIDTRWLAAVGDRYQSIYAFRGAISDSMDVLRQRFSMEEYKLSISFRCPKAVVELARKRAPYMQWSDSAIDGEVTHMTDSPWGPAIFEPGSAVICRNNAPLFSLGLKLIKAGRGVTIKGFDLSKRLIKILEEFGDQSMPREQLISHIDGWKSARIREGKLAESTIEDRWSCLRVFAEATPSLGEAIEHAKRLFSAEGPLELTSGHKSKGLEWDHVYHLDPWRIPSPFSRSFEDQTQEANLEYVITTRAKRSLTLLNLDDYDPEI